MLILYQSRNTKPLDVLQADVESVFWRLFDFFFCIAVLPVAVAFVVNIVYFYYIYIIYIFVYFFKEFISIFFPGVSLENSPPFASIRPLPSDGSRHYFESVAPSLQKYKLKLFKTVQLPGLLDYRPKLKTKPSSLRDCYSWQL